MDFDDNNGNDFEEDQEDIIEESQYQKRHPAFRILAVILLLAFIGLAIPQISLLFTDRLEFLRSRVDLRDSPELQQAASAVVSIEAYNEDQYNHRSRRGTGFNILDTGLIMTNQHIVENSGSVKIEFENGTILYSHDIQFIDNADVAFIKLDSQSLPCVSLHSETVPEPGSIVSVIGNPLGLKQVILRGPVIGYYNLEKNPIPIMLLDIDCQPGNSGSPVINEQGQVVGVVYAVTVTEEDGKTRNSTLAYPLYYFRDYMNDHENTRG
ncbi:htra protease/chaperone protein [hydrocarbon metagenome]|uniref:Htra protease/chaperone protein n=1 Tax=hydrocarbon metagenome TaxID=938273 RepID=A0A0W8E9D2_9ZZZZ